MISVVDTAPGQKKIRSPQKRKIMDTPIIHFILGVVKKKYHVNKINILQFSFSQLNDTYSLEQISKTGTPDATLILRQ